MVTLEEYIKEVKETLDSLPYALIEDAVNILHETRLASHQVFIMGNGGSASTASHFVCDLAKNTRQPGWPHFRVIGLTDNMALFSAFANDEGYDSVFAQQLANLVQPNDVVIGISASGKSPNVLRGIETANQVGAKTIGLTGFDGGKLANLVQINIHIPSHNIGLVEDIHMMVVHMISKTLREMAYPEWLEQSSAYSPHMDEYTMGLVNKLFGKSILTSEEIVDDTNRTPGDLFYKISQEFAEKMDLHDLLGRILQLTLNSIGAASGSILVLDDKGEAIDGALAYAGKIQPQSMEQLHDIMEHGLAGWVALNRQAALVPSTKNDPRWLPRAWENTDGQSRSALSVPLVTQERVVGVVTLVHPQTGRFTMEDLALLTAIAITISYSFRSKGYVKESPISK